VLDIDNRDGRRLPSMAATVINTGTTIVTLLMVFVIQHTQNREAQWNGRCCAALAACGTSTGMIRDSLTQCAALPDIGLAPSGRFFA
jgi:hypothetical protein